MTASTARSANVGTFAEVVGGARVVVCCGSGGVGKTTTAAVIGIEAARRGRRAVVVTIDPARRLADALGLPDGLDGTPRRLSLDHFGPGPERDADAGGELWAMMLDTAAMFDQVVRANAGSETQAERILANRFYRNIAGSVSGTQEYMASEALHQLHDDARFDLVVVDTPPSRHALDFLEAPGVLTRFLDHWLFRLMMLPARGGLRVVGAAAQPVLRAIGRVVGSDVLADAVAFFQAFAGMEGGFRDRAEQVTGILRADDTRFVLVASPRHDTVEEARWFAEQLHRHHLPVAAAVVNRVHPAFGGTEASAATDAAGAAADPQQAALWRNLAEVQTIAARERDELAPLALVGDGAPMVLVPLLDDDVHDVAALEAIARHLFPPA